MLSVTRMYLCSVFCSAPALLLPFVYSMDFSDDEDFFARAGNDEEEHAGFQCFESYQPEDDMPPPDEEMFVPPGNDGVQQRETPPAAERTATASEQVEEPATSPSRTTDASSPTSSSSSPSLPLQVGRGRKRLLEKAAPAGPWIGVEAPAPAASVSSQPQ